MSPKIIPTTNEIVLNEDDLIVSKTCLQGNITYANRQFMEIAGFSEAQLLGRPHNIIRHPDMPKAVYRLMWKAIREGQEFFGFVKNLTAEGGFYWVFANVTPDRDEQGQIRGYFSVRRKPSQQAIEAVTPLYRRMCEIEAAGTGNEVMERSVSCLTSWVQASGLDYGDLVLHLYRHGCVPVRDAVAS